MIEKSRIYVGTIERLVKKVSKDNEAKAGNYLVDELYKEEDIVLISFNTNLGVRYVPLYCVNNLFRLASISLASKQSMPNDRFIPSLQDCGKSQEGRTERAWVSSFERLFAEEGKTNLKELVEIQNKLHGNDNKKPIIL